MRIIFLLLFALILSAQTLQVGEKVTSTTLKSQHDKEYKLLNNGYWLIAWDKGPTKIANEYFKKNKMPKNLNFIVDTTQIPFGLFSLFAKSKLKKYKHPVLLNFDDDFTHALPFKNKNLTLLHLRDAKVQI